MDGQSVLDKFTNDLTAALDCQSLFIGLLQLLMMSLLLFTVAAARSHHGWRVSA
jgi:hypothetical protein